MTLVVVHRLTISYPDLWLGLRGAPSTVRAAVAAAPGVLDRRSGEVATNFLDEEDAREIAKFWRHQFQLGQFGRVQGADVVLEGSNPVTWPSDGAA